MLEELAKLRAVIEKPLELGNWATRFGLAPTEPGQVPTRPPGWDWRGAPQAGGYTPRHHHDLRDFPAGDLLREFIQKLGSMPRD